MTDDAFLVIAKGDMLDFHSLWAARSALSLDVLLITSSDDLMFAVI